MMRVRQSKSQTSLKVLVAPFLFLILVLIVLRLQSWQQESIESKSLPFKSSAKEYSYDPRNCTHLVNGHCNDEDGGAWTYRNGLGCTYVEETPLINNAPKDNGAVVGIPDILPDVQSVMDFGGGVGVYLTGFRNKGVTSLVTVEPIPLENCLFSGVVQDTTDWINTPLSQLPSKKYDLVMTIEAAEHIPVHFHQHLIQALAQATSKWLLFSAAHPGQPGEGHVGPSMKTKEQWIEDIQTWTSLRVDAAKSEQLYSISGPLLKQNCVIFRKEVSE